MSFRRLVSLFLASTILFGALLPMEASAAWTYQYGCGRSGCQRSGTYSTKPTCEAVRLVTPSALECTGFDDAPNGGNTGSQASWTFQACGRGGCQPSGAFVTQAACEAASGGQPCTQNGPALGGGGRAGSGSGNGAGAQNVAPSNASMIDYTPLVNLPFIGSGVQTIGGYLLSLFRLLIGLCGILAVVRMVICGFEAIISLNPSARSEASSCVLGALTGLLLALSAWLLLYQINPTILNTNFQPALTGSSASGGGSQNGG